MGQFICFSVIFLVLTRSAFGQINELSQLEKRINSSIEAAYAASVRIWGFDTIRQTQNSSQFSGVVVSHEGHILTVSHAIVPGRIYKVRFPDGKEVIAIALGRIGLAQKQNRPDLGMMKIIGTGAWPVAKMGWSYSSKVNESCIGISYPEKLNQLLPTVRFGRITNVMDQWDFVESTCKMEPGDSGGPLFDVEGRVVALHSRCNEPEEENFEVPVDMYRKYWTALNTPEDYKILPADTDDVKKDPITDSHWRRHL
ncbi:MAG TPA: serine protease [Chitinophagaceae bacterium]|nr:serine protease [Chitinophagaceae bacterium]